MKNFRFLSLPLFLVAPFWTQFPAHAAPETSIAKTVTPLLMMLNGIREAKLSNGVTVLSKEVRGAPVVYFSVWYHVGSVNEQVGQSGMSHLLEHMMFKGTKTRKPGEISAYLQQNGAQFNATTSFDRTNYFETIASDRLEKAMQLEADRMVNSLFDEKEHQKEMTVVRSEYEGGENNPGTSLGKAVRLAAFQVHPYRWTPIGFRSDIENISRDEMYDYYRNYYAPENATVVMVGDFNTPDAMKLLEKYFGSIPRRNIQRHFITPEPVQQGERRVIVRRAGTTPQIQIVHHIPGFGDPDRYALDVLENVLSGGRTSRFFEKLVQSGLASDANAYDYGLRDPDLFYLDADAQPGHTNAELEKALLAEVERVKTEPISADELKRTLKQAEAQYVFGQDSVQSQGSELGGNAMRGDWRYGETYLENLRRVTPADVQRVANKYLVETNRTVGYFEPIVGEKAPAAAAQNPNAQAAALTRPLARLANNTPQAAASAASRSATRILVPSISAHAQMKPALKVEPKRMALDNGITVIVQENHATPAVSLSGALLSAGSVFDPQDKPGLANFTAGLLSRGTETRSILDIARTLEDVGASANVGGGEEYVSLGGRSLTGDFGTMLDILADELRNPNFPEAEIEKARTRALAGLEDARQDTGTLAQIAFANAIYPVGHPYHEATLDERIASIKAITRDDMVKFYQSHYGPERLVLTVVGDVNSAQASDAIKQRFGDWKKQGDLPKLNIKDTDIATAATKTSVIMVPDKTQADVLYGYAGHLKRSDPDFYRVIVLNTILGGGGLTSRLAVNVRDRLGLVYGIYAGTDASLGAGPFTVRFGSNPANVDKAIAEMQSQISLARDKGFTEKEVQDVIDYLTGSYAITLSTNSGVAGQLLAAEVYGLGDDYIQKRNGYYKAITPAMVNEAARKYLQPGMGTLVIAGTYQARNDAAANKGATGGA